jgi:hypothetical protein
MPKEPYNLFATPGSTLPGGTAYEDLLVIIKAIVADNGGTLEVSEKNLMYVDRDEMLRVDDVFIDGHNRKIFSIQMKDRNQTTEGCVTHEVSEPEEQERRIPLWAKFIAALIWSLVIFTLIMLAAQVIRVML